MHFLTKISIISLLIFSISSCSVHEEVFQKRKYQKGHYLSLKKKNNGLKNDKHLDNTIEQNKDSASKKVILKKNIEPTTNTLLVSVLEEEKATQTNKTSEQIIKTTSSRKNTTFGEFRKNLPFKIGEHLKINSLIPSDKAAITSTSIFNSDLLTTVVISILIIGTIIALQMIEGQLGLLIGVGLILAAIVIFVT